MRDLLTVLFMGLGAAFMLVAAIGVVRLPDLFTRMHAATKAATLGAACVATAAMLHFGTHEVVYRAVLIIVFLCVTAPVAAHALSRAAYRVNVPLWSGSVRDELRNRYDAGGRLLSRDPGPRHDR